MPRALATNRWRPGSRRSGVAHEALRVTVLPEDVAYASSRPARSTALAPTFVISANSSDADAPPVCTSETRRVETGHGTDPRAAASGSARVANAAPATDSITDSAANTATRVRSTVLDLRAGAGEAGRDGSRRSSRQRLPGDHPALSYRLPADWLARTERVSRRYDVEPAETQGGHVARAKQTDRAEARRRYRQAGAADSTEVGDAAELDYGERRPVSGQKPAARGARPQDKAPAGRTGFLDSFRMAYHPAHVREDLRALPELLRSRAFLAGLALLLIGGAVWLLFPLRSGSILLWELLVVPGSALAPQLVGGFFAPRAS